jgi:hypothetical protein
VELVLLEGAFVTLPVLEILCAFSVEHAVVPVALILSIATFSIQHSPTTLDTIPELTLIPAAITPPESTAPIAFSALELTLIDVALLTRPVVDASPLFLVKPELTKVVVASSEVELTLSLKLPIVEISVDDLVSTLEEANALAVRSVDLSLSNIDDFCVFKEFGVVERRFYAKNNW